MQKSKRLKWSLVDLRRPASELAAELGTTRQAIYAARRRLGIEVENSAGGSRAGAGAPQGNSNRTLPDDQRIKMTYVRMLPAEIDALKRHAARHKLTYSELVRLVLQKYLREQEQADNG